LQETNLALFLVASLALKATPGPDMLYVVTCSHLSGARPSPKLQKYAVWGCLSFIRVASLR
jgi:threonine/homoserine/homoserine lactone efflux protein